ncbi:hypothetical protein ACCO45_008228 [Purpureocillium lilacinum]|uniref:Uncharacterized protein n=1 Tax=Purpureocillium lilacinum TaxID=33203 RepID=A0ACC4DQT2_PURLI
MCAGEVCAGVQGAAWAGQDGTPLRSARRHRQGTSKPGLARVDFHVARLFDAVARHASRPSGRGGPCLARGPWAVDPGLASGGASFARRQAKAGQVDKPRHPAEVPTGTHAGTPGRSALAGSSSGVFSGVAWRRLGGALRRRYLEQPAAALHRGGAQVVSSVQSQAPAFDFPPAGTPSSAVLPVSKVGGPQEMLHDDRLSAGDERLWGRPSVQQTSGVRPNSASLARQRHRVAVLGHAQLPGPVHTHLRYLPAGKGGCSASQGQHRQAHLSRQDIGRREIDHCSAHLARSSIRRNTSIPRQPSQVKSSRPRISPLRPAAAARAPAPPATRARPTPVPSLARSRSSTTTITVRCTLPVSSAGPCPPHPPVLAKPRSPAQPSPARPGPSPDAEQHLSTNSLPPQPGGAPAPHAPANPTPPPTPVAFPPPSPSFHRYSRIPRRAEANLAIQQLSPVSRTSTTPHCRARPAPLVASAIRRHDHRRPLLDTTPFRRPRANVFTGPGSPRLARESLRPGVPASFSPDEPQTQRPSPSTAPEKRPLCSTALQRPEYPKVSKASSLISFSCLLAARSPLHAPVNRPSCFPFPPATVGRHRRLRSTTSVPGLASLLTWLHARGELPLPARARDRACCIACIASLPGTSSRAHAQLSSTKAPCQLGKAAMPASVARGIRDTHCLHFIRAFTSPPGRRKQTPSRPLPSSDSALALCLVPCQPGFCFCAHPALARTPAPEAPVPGIAPLLTAGGIFTSGCLLLHA